MKTNYLTQLSPPASKSTARQCSTALLRAAFATLCLLAMSCPASADPIISNFTADSSNSSIGTMSLANDWLSPANIITLASGSNIFNDLALRAEFTVAGTYTFTQTSGNTPVDTVGILYTTFDPAHPQSTYITGDDDSGGHLKPQFTFVINGPGTRDIVISTYSSNTTLGLPQGFQFSGPGLVTVFAIGSSMDDQLSAMTTGLPVANAEGPMLISGSQTVTADINGHLFNLRAGDGEEAANDGIAALVDQGVIVGQGDGDPERKTAMARKVLRSRQWEVFSTVNYGNVKLNAINNQAGVQIDSWAPSVGIERHLSRGLAVGFATTFLTSDQSYTSGLGHLHLEGPALSAYASFVRKNYWSSLLYNFGSYQMDSVRNPGFGFATAMGSTRTYTNAVQYNTGWNFRFQNNTLVTGPFAGIDYLHGTVNAYGEAGGGLAALRYGKQTYQSLVTRVGWSASKKMQTSWAAITPQLRLSYERQNLSNNGTSVSLINAPFTAAGGSQNPGQSYMVAGAGVNFQFNDQFSMLLSYQGQFFRNNLEAHFGSVRLGYKF
jgi:uncharacterized protein YhjY with autotransporter beta-barrel domain